MSVMRGVAPFEELWKRRTPIDTGKGGVVLELLTLQDLVRAKKTQCDKDWPMIRRLVEANYFENRREPNPDHVRFWLLELRTPSLMIELASRHPVDAESMGKLRPLLTTALNGDEPLLAASLHQEECAERELARQYWAPLRAELVALRHQERR